MSNVMKGFSSNAGRISMFDWNKGNAAINPNISAITEPKKKYLAWKPHFNPQFYRRYLPFISTPRTIMVPLEEP